MAKKRNKRSRRNGYIHIAQRGSFKRSIQLVQIGHFFNANHGLPMIEHFYKFFEALVCSFFLLHSLNLELSPPLIHYDCMNKNYTWWHQINDLRKVQARGRGFYALKGHNLHKITLGCLSTRHTLIGKATPSKRLGCIKQWPCKSVQAFRR